MIVDVTISHYSFLFVQLHAKVSVGFTNVSSLAVTEFDLVYCSLSVPVFMQHVYCKVVVYVRRVKESQYYSLPFGQAVASMYKSFQLDPKPFLISRIDYNPSVI